MDAEAEPLQSLIAYIQTGEPIPRDVFFELQNRPMELIRLIGQSGIKIYQGEPEYRYQLLCRFATGSNPYNKIGDADLLKDLGINGE